MDLKSNSLMKFKVVSKLSINGKLMEIQYFFDGNLLFYLFFMLFHNKFISACLTEIFNIICIQYYCDTKIFIRTKGIRVP
jgi:hypothetical protein